MKKDVIILGAGGHAKVIAEIVIKSGDNLIGFLADDDNKQKGQEIYLGKKLIGTIDDCINYQDAYFIIGIGDNNARKNIANRLNLKWYTAIHPSAIIASDVKIGEGSVIMPIVVINPGTIIGKHCIINTSSSVDHDNIIEDYVHISPGAHLAGTVTIKEGTWICTGVTIINKITINKNNIIGAGAVVIKNIYDTDSIYAGVPIKKIISGDKND